MPASEQAIPKTQRQWQHAQAGLPKDALRLIQEAAVPSPSAGEVLVRITHVTPMPSSWKAMGILPGFLRKGSVPEMEGSGVVVDPGDSEFRKGHEVMGLVTPFDHLRNARGCLSEYALFKVSSPRL